MVAVILMGFLLGVYTMVIKKRKSIYDENGIIKISKQDSLILFASLACVVCRLMVFRMNIVNRYSYYLIAFIFLLYPRALRELSHNNKKAVKWIIYLFLFGYFTMMTLLYEKSFHMTVPYQFFWSLN